MAMWIQGWCPWCGDHMTGGGWGMMFGWSLILFALIALVFFLARGGWSAGRGGRREEGGTRDRAEEALREQYARGEIDEQTYRRRLEELRRG